MELHDLVERFRNALVRARDNGDFENDDRFCNFPIQCCGDACYLLAEYLGEAGIETIYVWGEHNLETHAWLVLNDEDIIMPQKQYYEAPKEIINLIKQYGGQTADGAIDVSRYREADVYGGTIIDITADQFGREPIYINKTNEFYQKFEFRSANTYDGLYDKRLKEIYNIIAEYL